jgi:hypothetical protein
MSLTSSDDLVMVWGKYFMRHITPLLRSTLPDVPILTIGLGWICLHLLSSTWFATAFVWLAKWHPHPLVWGSFPANM